MPEFKWGSVWCGGWIRRKSDSSYNETVTRIEMKPTTNMEDFYIPLEIQADIIKRLPLKPLIRFRSVCKPWKSLIDSSKFISDHHRHHHSTNSHSPPEHLLVSHNEPERDRKYISVTHDGFTKHRNKLISCRNSQKNKQYYKLSTLTVPMSLKRFHKPTILGSDQGLFCLYEFKAKPLHSETENAVLWNPLLSKSVSIHVPNVIIDVPHFKTVLGFGFCPGTTDPKLVKINYNCPFHGSETVSCIPWQVEVFTLSSGVWRSPYQDPPSIYLNFHSDGVVIDGFIYWLAYSGCTVLVLSFNLKTEEFMEVYLPDSIKSTLDISLNISKLRESLVVLEHFDDFNEESFCVVWIMEHGVPNAMFTKLYTIKRPQAFLRKVLGFSKNGEAIIQSANACLCRPGNHEKFDFSYYEPTSKHMNHIGIPADPFSSFASSYTETLLLLDH